MDSIGIITDSVACLPPELTEKYQISIIPAGNIFYKGKTYRDMIDLNHVAVYRILESSPQEFSTGSTSPGEFIEIYQSLSKKHNAILYISLSAKFSTLCNVARLARDMVKKDLPDVRIEIMDSRTATAAEGFIAIAAARAAQEGKNLDEVMKIAQEIRRKVDLFYVLETIRYVYRTGRVPRTVATVGSKLNVKPLITVRNGAAVIRGLVRNTDRGIESLVKIARQEINNHSVHMAILHADARAEAEILKEKLSSIFQFEELWISEFSPLMVYATGRGVLGIAFYIEDSRSP
jgi:DegV family protein with EDD domain